MTAEREAAEVLGELRTRLTDLAAEWETNNADNTLRPGLRAAASDLRDALIVPATPNPYETKAVTDD